MFHLKINTDMKNIHTESPLQLKGAWQERLQTQSGRLRGLYAQRLALVEQLKLLNDRIYVEEQRTYDDLLLLDQVLNAG